MVDVRLRVNGREYAGWKTVQVTRGIEAIAGGFDLSVSERWNGQTTPWPIVEEDECTLLVGNDVVIIGYVDKREISYGSAEHSLRVSGRDRTGLLVDCSAVLKSWEFQSVPLLTLIQRLCDPFSIKVSLDPSVTGAAVTLKVGKGGGTVSAGGAGKHTGLGVPKPPKKFSVDPGESTFEVIDRACRMAGVLPVSDGAGGLLLTRAGTSRVSTALVEGENILAAHVSYDASARYARYVVRGQQAGDGKDWFGGPIAAVSGEAIDANVRRTERVLLIRPEAGTTREQAQARAGWEAGVRAGRAETVSITVQDWVQSSGALWPINALVYVQAPLLGVDGDLLITQTMMSLDDQGGTTSQLTLKRPDAFLPEPVVTTGATALWKEIAKGV